jgi:deoxyribonuclease-2
MRRTLDSVLVQPPATTGWIFYNDQMPASMNKKDNNNLGHTKGVLAFDTATNSAYWLLHSWPKFVDTATHAMPTPLYGQTFLCLTLDLAVAREIAVQMELDQDPQSYRPRLPDSLPANDPLRVLAGPQDSDPPDASVKKLKTAGGKDFMVIAKNKKWNRDFWNDLVVHELDDDMDDETWIRGPVAPLVDPNGVHRTADIKFIDTTAVGAPWIWPETKDHAKWGITLNKTYVCVGDMNRMISQRQRGGGTIALQEKNLWSALKATERVDPPAGHTHETAKALIKETHRDPDADVGL